MLVPERRSNMNGSKLDKEYLTLNFESGKDAMKMLLLYFIEFFMMGRERRQHINWTMLGLIHELEDFVRIKYLGTLKRALKGKIAIYKKKPTNKKSLESYSLYGFPFAL